MIIFKTFATPAIVLSALTSFSIAAPSVELERRAQCDLDYPCPDGIKDWGCVNPPDLNWEVCALLCWNSDKTLAGYLQVLNQGDHANIAAQWAVTGAGVEERFPTPDPVSQSERVYCSGRKNKLKPFGDTKRILGVKITGWPVGAAGATRELVLKNPHVN